MFTINGYHWQVYLVSENHPMLIKADGTLTIGVCDKSTGKIYINEKLNDFYIKKVLCHEIVHAAMFSYGILLTDQEEEIIADLIATFGEKIIEITNSIFSKLIYR